MAGYGGIWRDMAGYGQIWSDMVRYGQIWRDTSRYRKKIVRTLGLVLLLAIFLAVLLETRGCALQLVSSWRMRRIRDPLALQEAKLPPAPVRRVM